MVGRIIGINLTIMFNVKRPKAIYSNTYNIVLMTRSQYNYRQKIKEWIDIGFNPLWLTKLSKEPAASDTCGLRGNTATTVLRILEGYGCIRRGKIQSNHKRLWIAGPQHNKWLEAIKNIPDTVEAST